MQIVNVGIFNEKKRLRPQLRQLNEELISDGSDIIGIIESGFKFMSPSREAVRDVFENFIVHRLDWESCIGHGLLLFVRKTEFTSVNVLEKNSNFEQEWVEVEMNDSSKLVICLGYSAPSCNSVVPRLENILNNCRRFRVKEDDKFLVVMGDFNLKINYDRDGKMSHCNSFCKMEAYNLLQKIMNEFHLIQCNPYRFGGSTIDLFLCNADTIANVACVQKRMFFERQEMEQLHINNSHMNLQYRIELPSKKRKLNF